jgi:hypothetical protein
VFEEQDKHTFAEQPSKIDQKITVQNITIMSQNVNLGEIASNPLQPKSRNEQPIYSKKYTFVSPRPEEDAESEYEYYEEEE